MNIFRELNRLQVQAEGHPVAESIADLRRVLILDAARHRAGMAMDAARPKKGFHPSHQQIVIAGRVVSVPVHITALLAALPVGSPVTRPILAARIYGRDCKSQRDRITAGIRTARSVLRVQDSGLSIYTKLGPDAGYTLLAEPLTLAQAQEARAVS